MPNPTDPTDPMFLPVFDGPDGSLFGEWVIWYRRARMMAPRFMQTPERLVWVDQDGRPQITPIDCRTTTLDGGWSLDVTLEASNL